MTKKNPNIILEDNFYKTYKPQTNHIERESQSKDVADEDLCAFGGTMYETYGEEFDYVRHMASNTKTEKKIWTVLDCDGDLIVSAGFHYVNRMGYIITKKEWETGEEYVEND